MFKRILILFCLTACGCIVLYPEIFIFHRISFLSWGDYVIPYVCAHQLTTFLYQGGVQLWDYFGQMPHALLFNTFGVFQIPYALTAGVYYVGSFFASNSGEYFHHVFSVVYVGSLIMIQVFGIYLLLRRVSNDQRVLITASVIFGLFFCNPALVMGWFFQTFYPVLMYAFLSFFVTLRLRYLAMSALLTVILLNQSIVYTCYTFLTIHLFLIVCLVWAWFEHRKKLRAWNLGLGVSLRRFTPQLIVFAVLTVILLAPYVYIQFFELNSLEFGKASSRMAHIWDIGYYFHNKDMFFLDHRQYFKHMLDLTGNVGYVSSYFFGFMFFLLATIGMCFSKDTKKWIFAGTLLLVWFLNFPRDHFNIGWIAHILTAVTNPVAIVVRDYNLATLCIIPFLLFPLVVLGVNVILEILKNKGGSHAGRWSMAAGLMFVFVMLNMTGQPAQTKVYLYAYMLIAAIAGSLIFMSRRRTWRTAGVFILAILFVGDATFSWREVKNQLLTYQIRPRQVKFAEKPLWLDYQNPKIFPFVDHFEFEDVNDGDHNPYLWTLREASTGFFHVLNQEIVFVPPDGHNPRHVSYAKWWKDDLMRKYFRENSQVFFFAKYAVQDQPGIVQEIVGRGLARDVIGIEGKRDDLLPYIPDAIKPMQPLADQWTISAMTELMDFWDRFDYDGRMMVWNFKVNGQLPPHIATTALTKEPSIRFAIKLASGKMLELEPVQGGFVQPLSFDMQNIKEGEVRAALPIDSSFSGAKGILLMKTNPEFGLLSVIKHTNDRMEFHYNARDNGWLGIHLPYDRRWQIIVDGKITRYWRMNKSFMAVPIIQGPHLLSVQYEPHTWLRWGLFTALIAALVSFFGVFLAALRSEDKQR